MSKINILATGKIKGSVYEEAFNYYAQRIKTSLQISEINPKNKHNLIEEEFAEFNKLIGKNSNNKIIALDINGELISSEGFSKLIFSFSDNYSFLIGGADGLSPKLQSQIDYKISFGRVTWPHLLARLLLIEQLYRAELIHKNHPYHH